MTVTAYVERADEKVSGELLIESVWCEVLQWALS